MSRRSWSIIRSKESMEEVRMELFTDISGGAMRA